MGQACARHEVKQAKQRSIIRGRIAKTAGTRVDPAV